MSNSRPSSKSPRLTDTQLVILSAASQTPFGSAWPVPTSVKAAPTSIRKTIKRLIEGGLLNEIQSTKDLPPWREEGDSRFGLVITQKGVVALGLDESSKSSETDNREPDDANLRRSQPTKSRTKDSAGTNAPKQLPRQGTKLEALFKLLRNKKGVSVEKLMDATGWQAHSVRAALTGLRKRGIAVEKHKAANGQTMYTATTE